MAAHIISTAKTNILKHRTFLRVCLLRSSRTFLAQQELLHKQNGGIEKKILVFLFGVSVPFVIGHQKPGLNAIALQLVEHLPGLRPGHTRIVFPYGGKNRLADLL